MVVLPILGWARQLDLAVVGRLAAHAAWLSVSLAALFWLAGARVRRRSQPPSPHRNLATRALVGVPILLTAWGLVLLHGLGPAIAAARGQPGFETLALAQLWALALALPLWFLAAALPALPLHRALAGRRFLLLALTAAALLATAFFGHAENGRRLWLRAGALGFQPIEPLKLVIVVAASAILAETAGRLERARGGRSRPALALPFALAYLAPLAALAVQGDLGPALVLAPLGAVMYAAATRDLLTPALAGILALGAVAALLLSGLAMPILEARVEQWLDPFGHGETAARSLWAIAAGGLTGVGLGRGQAETIPVVHADYVFSAWVEETGAVGGLVLVGALGLFAWRALDVARDAPTRGLALTAAGLGLLLLLQGAVSVGGNLGLIPQTGITFPFVSHGGSSLVVCFIAVGLVLAVARSSSREGGAPGHGCVRLRGEGAIRVGVLALVVVLVGATVFRSQIQADSIARSVYRAEPERAWLGQLVEAQSFAVADGRVVVDGERLERAEPSGRRRRRAVVLATTLRVQNDEPALFAPALHVANPRHRVPAARGEIVDRAGRPLAVDRGHGPDRRREYPGGPALAPVVGLAGGVYGARGAEATLANFLRGAEPAPLWVQGLVWLGGPPARPRAVLSVDYFVQDAAYSALRGRRGAVVALDVRTGGILALVSSPAFDPNAPPGPAWIRADRDPSRPFAERATRELFAPGSSFKVVTAAAALESEDPEAFPEPGFECLAYNARYRMHEIHPLGPVDLARAFAHSCNAFFAETGNRVGPRLARMAERLGFGQPIDVPGLPRKAVASYAIGPREPSFYAYNPRLVAQASIGQNLVAATPLQMALVAAAVANGGWRVEPYLVEMRALVAASGAETRYARADAKRTRALSTATARRLRELMGGVVREGTARRLPALQVGPAGLASLQPRQPGETAGWGAKSGTAQIGDANGDGRIGEHEQPHAWMIGFAPLEDPRVAVAVLVENGGGGARVAGPIAAEVLAAALNALPEPRPVLEGVAEMLAAAPSSQ